MQPDQTPSASQEKIDFFLVSAHELRTSLSAMKWLLKMLCDGDYGALSEEQHAAITQAISANDHMVALLNDTMTAIKTDTPVAYAKEPVQFGTLVADMVKEFANEASERSITITFYPSATNILVLGDENRLRIALHNLIENAIKYSNAHSDIAVALTAQDGKATLVVQDHGAGIPVEKQSHLFEKFYRAGNTDQPGTGLGLYSTKHVIEQHNGTISIGSIEHIGKTVTVTLPLSQ
ncbi:MAG: HAMP domain-containing sensor histidine kinase [Patescibacteria group bacterium]